MAHLTQIGNLKLMIVDWAILTFAKKDLYSGKQLDTFMFKIVVTFLNIVRH